MLNFQVALKAGSPIYEQIVLAVKRAVALGQLSSGDPFPSVRELSSELRINPNTVQKVISALVQERLLEVRPGIGTVVSDRRRSSPEQIAELLDEKLETLIIEAITLGASQQQFITSVNNHWHRVKQKEKKI